MERVAGAAVHYALPDRFGFGIMYTHHKWRIGGGSSRTFAGRYGRGRGIGEFMAASIMCVGATSERTMEENA